jgi:hypothetical protein
MRATWYVLEDGTSADPAEVSPDEKGVLRHKSGAAVAMRDTDTPRARSVDVEEERAKTAPVKREVKAEESAPAKDREMKPGKAKHYKTR